MEIDDDEPRAWCTAAVNQIRLGQGTEKEIQLILEALANVMRPILSQSVQEARNKSGPLKFQDMVQSNIRSSYEAEHKIVKIFFSAVALKPNEDRGTREMRLRFLCRSIDCLKSAVNIKYVSPGALAESLVLRYFSGSRAATDLLNKTNPTGSYTLHKDVTKEFSTNTPKYPKGDIIVAFDNNQAFGHSYRIRYNASPLCSVVTTIAVFAPVNLALTPMVNIPTTLRLPLSNPTEVMNQYMHYYDEVVQKTCKDYRTLFIKERFGVVMKRIEFDENGIPVDDVSRNRYVPTADYASGIEYEKVPKHEMKFTCHDQECLPMNPNSFATVAKVLDSIVLKSFESDPDRKSIVVVCDGIPYSIALTLIQETLYCTACKRTMKEKDVTPHFAERNCKGRRADVIKKYQKIILRPGNGHYELNLTREILDTFFDVYVKDVARMIGYNTPKALDLCRKGYDHHRTWQLLKVILLALTDELIFEYVSHAARTGRVPSVAGFSDYCSNATSKNFRLAYIFLFNNLLVLFLYRSGTRQCNKNVTAAAREKLSVLLYAFNHPKYRRLNAQDQMYRLLTEPKSSMAHVESFTIGESSKGEGADFKLEYRNHVLKSWTLGHGVPTVEDWVASSRALPVLEQVRSSVRSRLALHGDERSDINLNREQFEARKIYRQYATLNAYETSPLVTATKEKLPISDDFLDFMQRGETNRIKYYNAYIRGEKVFLMTCLKPLSTNDTLTEKQIVARIHQAINCLPEDMRSDYRKILQQATLKEDKQELLGVIEEDLKEIEYAESRE